ncbi:MAG: eukaryotic-like serine/threonine-protein kinase [Miltoncostaeaceae bacterium]|nr:eukaryotic-like serine/threonine-protein kinase [Miltoncostaeaceae bacterium]
MTTTLLGERYRLDELIGRGGMATVWRATDTVLDRHVAVKRLHPTLTADEELAERFRREARLVARLSHPNLVHLLDRGEDDQGPYLVMELVQGENLKSRIKRDGAMSVEEAVSVVGQVASALAYAHEQGVVHRDIKAQNVLLQPDGHAKLADFGIARLMEVDGTPGLTRTDVLMGSADYLSPEQAEGDDIDERTDIYSLGIVLYECLTGELPFKGEGFVAVAMRHLTEAMPDPRDVDPDIPDHLAACVLRATEKGPSQRFASARDFAHALHVPLDESTAIMAAIGYEPAEETAIVTRPRVRRRRRRTFAAIGLWALAALVAAATLIAVLDPFGGNDRPRGEVLLALASVTDYDPDGDHHESPNLTALAHDGNSGTAWTTERYNTPDFSGFGKEGVGLLMRLRQPARAAELVVTSDTPGVPFRVLGARDSNGVRQGMALGELTGGRQVIPLVTDGPRAIYLLWITGLVPKKGGGYEASIGEVELRGAANQ